MTHSTGGQSSQSAGDDREPTVAQHWSAIPVDVLRTFVSELCARITYRAAAARTGVSKTALQKIVNGETQPNHSTRQRLGALFQELYADGSMWKRTLDGEWEIRVRLIELLPAGEETARAELAKIFELAKRHPDEVPASVDQVHEWVDLQVRGEYNAERSLDAIGRRKRAPKGQGKRTRAAKRDAPPE